jgi:hypothetical protein
VTKSLFAQRLIAIAHRHVDRARTRFRCGDYETVDGIRACRRMRPLFSRRSRPRILQVDLRDCAYLAAEARNRDREIAPRHRAAACMARA